MWEVVCPPDWLKQQSEVSETEAIQLPTASVPPPWIPTPSVRQGWGQRTTVPALAEGRVGQDREKWDRGGDAPVSVLQTHPSLPPFLGSGTEAGDPL